jgi:hypothetical protein
MITQDEIMWVKDKTKIPVAVALGIQGLEIINKS